MSTSDQQGPLTRKQLREIRLTGSTPVITPEEAAAAAGSSEEPAPQPAPEQAHSEPAPAPALDLPRGSAPLTRRQVRELERSRTASVPVADAPEPTESTVETDDSSPAQKDDADAIVSSVPDFARPSTDGDDVADADTDTDTDTDSDDDVIDVDTAGDDDDVDDEIVVEQDPPGEPQDADVVEEHRPTVNPAFGEALLTDESEPKAPFRPSFDELLTVDSAGSQHTAPNALIFTPSPGEGSLSGPVASTGEILVTGSYELPRGMGSQGHAHGTTDGKDIDAVLIDGELPPASSPTPIAASSAVSTIKPAGEVIRPPAPEKGNKLMLVLTIIAGGLALAVATAVIIAITTNVF